MSVHTLQIYLILSDIHIFSPQAANTFCNSSLIINIIKGCISVKRQMQLYRMKETIMERFMINVWYVVCLIDTETKRQKQRSKFYKDFLLVGLAVSSLYAKVTVFVVASYFPYRYNRSSHVTLSTEVNKHGDFWFMTCGATDQRSPSNGSLNPLNAAEVFRDTNPVHLFTHITQEEPEQVDTLKKHQCLRGCLIIKVQKSF